MMPLTSTPPYLFVFYSSGYLHNRDLHSFPTRRSSDLNATYPFLDFDKQMKTAVLCGRESVQIRPTTNKRRDLNRLAEQLKVIGGKVEQNPFLVSFTVNENRMVVFEDGRAIIHGTKDVEQARTMYHRYLS